MRQDEAGTLARLKALRRELIDPKITEHRAASSRRPVTAYNEHQCFIAAELAKNMRTAA
jgi:hypothetical protein